MRLSKYLKLTSWWLLFPFLRLYDVFIACSRAVIIWRPLSVRNWAKHLPFPAHRQVSRLFSICLRTYPPAYLPSHIPTHLPTNLFLFLLFFLDSNMRTLLVTRSITSDFVFYLRRSALLSVFFLSDIAKTILQESRRWFRYFLHWLIISCFGWASNEKKNMVLAEVSNTLSLMYCSFRWFNAKWHCQLESVAKISNLQSIDML